MGILSNPKVGLRPIEYRDLNKLNQWKNDEEIYRYLGGGFLPVSIDIQNNWMESIMDTTGNNKRFMIENNEGESIGMIGLYKIQWINKICEIGIFIGEKNMQGKGYAKEAYCLIENYAYKYLNLRKIKAFAVRSNVAAVSMYQKLHFNEVGCMHDDRYIDGTYHDVLIMEKFLQNDSLYSHT